MLVSEALELVADGVVSRETCTGEIEDIDMNYPGDTCEDNFEVAGGTGAGNCAAGCTHGSMGDTAVIVAVRESLGMAPSSNPGELRMNLAEICYHQGLNPGWEYWTKDGTTESECCAPEACNAACRARQQADAARAALQKCRNVTVSKNVTAQEEAQAKLDCIAEELGQSASTIVAIVLGSVFVLVCLAYCVAKHLCCSGREESAESDSSSEDEEMDQLKRKGRSKVESESGSEDEETDRKNRKRADSGSESGSEDEETGKKSRKTACPEPSSGLGSASEDEPPEPNPEPEPQAEPKHHDHHRRRRRQPHSEDSGDEEAPIKQRSESPDRERADSPEKHHHHHHHHHHHGHP
jgi:hypothetical protein